MTAARPAGRRTSGIEKHSVVIAGHRTSISLETAFWQRLRTLAAERDLPLAGLIADIDARRTTANLSSAIRIFVLEDALRRSEPGAAVIPA